MQMTNGQLPQQQSKITTLVLDTQIIQFLGSEIISKSNAYWELLHSFTIRLFVWTISEITIFENTQGLWGSKAIAAYQLMRKFPTKVVDQKVLGVAAMLGGLYNHPEFNERYKKIDHGDKIIATTAILENGCVLTNNAQDFPPPFFFLTEHYPVVYTLKNQTKTDDIFLCVPNVKLIGRRIQEMDKSH